MGEMARYLRVREESRRHFAAAYPAVLSSFEVSLEAFTALAQQLRTGRDASGHTHVSLAPFYFILQRQTMAAFDSLSAGQAYVGWVTVRPGVESALIMGKWVDDAKNADVWANRFKNRKAYQDTYQGKALESRSLPRAPAIRSALSEINDLFVHPNPMYYYRHVELVDKEDGAVELKVNFFDETEDVNIGILSLLHLVITIQDSLAQMFAALFTGVSRTDVGLGSFEEKAGTWAHDLMAKSPVAKQILTTIGLWDTRATA